MRCLSQRANDPQQVTYKSAPKQWCMFGVVVTFSYRAPPSKYALFLAIAEQTVKTLLVHIIYQIISDGVAHRVDTKIGGIDLGPS